MFRYLLLAVSVVSLCDGHRYLVVFPMLSKSHNILGAAIVNHLLRAGHEVVSITSFPREKTVPRLKEVDVSSVLQILLKEPNLRMTLKDLVDSEDNFADSPIFFTWASKFSKHILENEEFKTFLNDPKEKFDAVILEWFFSELLAGLGPLYKCPTIWVASTEAHWQSLRLMDEITNPAYNLDMFSENDVPLSFLGRFDELWRIVKRMYTIAFTIVPMERDAYKELFLPIAAEKGVEMPSYDVAIYNASLMLLNSHPSMGLPYRLPLNVKHIGGYHINNKVDPLPQNIQNIMDEAKHGVVYFSMGSNLNSKDMSEEMKKSLLKVFGELDQVVLWKFEENVTDLPTNVHTLEWAPQQSILTHPNLRVFITHGGQLSTTEAIHFGVPVVGIPVYGDQFVNMRLAIRKGFGVTVALKENLAELLKPALLEVLANPRYSQQAKQLSSLYHDRPLSPGAELVYWVEHVTRSGGALHLRSLALPLPLYQKLYLDWIALIFTSIVICDLQKVFDESKDGVIYFSMGSNLKSKNIPEHIKRALLNMFGKFKQTVLWKFEEDLPDIPTNVHIVKWAPQPSILKHPNTLVFITHGGKLSTTETIHYGVPIIGIPIFGDQTLNMQVAVDKGFALMVKFSDDLANKLEMALTEIISNPKYSKKAKQLSAIYHDLPVSPRRELLHWVNHVIKTGGAHYLRSPSLDLNCIQKSYLDFIVVLTLILYSLYKIGKLLCRKKCDKTKTATNKKNN